MAETTSPGLVMSEAKTRISKAIRELDRLRRKPGMPIDEVTRIRGKIEGLRLAQYYLHEDDKENNVVYLGERV